MTGSPFEQESRTKGPRVWLDMDQKELDDAYDQSVWAPNQSHVSGRRSLWSESTRARLKPERIPYGPTEIEQLDIYKTTRGKAPTQIFIHGGAWRGGSAKNSAYPAEMFVMAGAIFIAVDFVSIEQADGNLMTMADQVRRAIAWVYRNAARFGGHPNRLFLYGACSGAYSSGVG